MRPYVVRQGDYLTKLAHRLGFDADRVWNDPKNDGLRARRPDPDLLAPGDVLHVPDRPEQRALSISARAHNRYKGTVPRVPIRVVLKCGDRAIADEPYVVTGLGGRPLEGRTGADGSVSFHAPVSAPEARIELPRRGAAYSVLIGHLDPIDEPSGVRQRLEHLGYAGGRGPSNPRAALDWLDEEEQDRAAIRAFQQANGLDATGELDERTRRAIADAHGD